VKKQRFSLSLIAADMTTKKLHVTIAILAFFGLLLSGYLTYKSLWSTGCSQGFISRYVSCGGSQKVLIFGQPTCIYGFAMYLVVFIVNAITWTKKQSSLWLTLVLLGIAGSLFSGGLTIYELFILNIQFTALPSCVYGLILYLGILVAAIQGRRQYSNHSSLVS